MKTVGIFLKEKRVAAGLTVRALDVKSEVSYSYISRVERDRQAPSLDVLARLLIALDVTWVEFLTETGYMKKGERIYEADEMNRSFAVHEKATNYKPAKK